MACSSLLEPSPWKFRISGARFEGSYDSGIESRYARSAPSTLRCSVVTPATAPRRQPLPAFVAAPDGAAGTIAAPTTTSTSAARRRVRMLVIIGRLGQEKVELE